MENNFHNLDDNLDLDIVLKNNRGQKGQVSKDACKKKKPIVNINYDLEKKIDQYARSDTSRELGGILMGSYFEYSDSYQLSIDIGIIATFTESTKFNLKFTHKTWEHINNIRDNDFPDKKVIGWFHTHPRLGVFLSKSDLFIQKNFFSFPWQVAYVVDPIIAEKAFFGWYGSRIVRIPKWSRIETEKNNESEKGKIIAYKEQFVGRIINYYLTL